MKVRNRKIIRRTLLTVVLIAAVLTIAQTLVLPRIVGTVVHNAFRSAGIDADFRVRWASPWGASVGDIRLVGSNEVAIDRLRFDYSPTGLRHGRIDAIRIRGATITANIENGRPRSVLIERLMNHPTTGETSASDSTGSIGQVQITRSTLIVKSPQQTVSVPVDATMQVSGNEFSVNATIDVGGPLKIAGTLASSSIDLTARATDANAAATTSLLSALIPNASIVIDGTLSLDAQLHFSNNRGRYEATLTARPPKDAPATAASATTNLVLTNGVFNCVGNLGNDDAPPLRVTAKDVSLSHPPQQLQVEKLAGDVTFTSLSPLTTPPAQHITVAAIHKKDLELANGTITFQVLSADHVHINDTHWQTFGGEIFASDFNISSSAAPITLQAKDLELARVLDELAQKKAQGRGSISGSINLIIDHGNIQFGEGQLTARRGGSIQIPDAADLGSTDLSPGQQRSTEQQVQQNVVEALKDFQFDSFTARLNDTSEGLVGHVRMIGHGRTGAKQGLDYELNVRGIDEVLNEFLGFQTPKTMRENAATQKGKAARS